MPAKKGNNYAVGNKGGGRKTGYKEEYAQLAYNYCLLGATNKELAIYFDVSEKTINKWKRAHEEFCSALKKGKAEADGVIAEKLFHRAKGYSHKAVKIFADVKTGEEMQVEYLQHYPPDTTACIFWLKNRRPDLWRDKVQNEHTTPDGKPLIAVYLPDNGRDKRND